MSPRGAQKAPFRADPFCFDLITEGKSMKMHDRVRLIREKEAYKKAGLKIGDEGTIMGEKRSGYYLVYFDGDIFLDRDGVYQTTEIDLAVLEEDLETIE